MEVSLNWLKSHWRWSALNLFAGCVLVYVLSQGNTGWTSLGKFDTGLESGKWAIRFLLTSLTMSPLNTYFGWRDAIKLRKSAGLWTFTFASVHLLLYLREAKFEWLAISMPSFYVFGLVGMSILLILACTSNRWAMQWLGKNWKRLHRLVYVSGIAVVTHSMLAVTMSKKIYVRDPEAPHELKIYVAILSVLLAVRLPFVRELLKQIPILLKRSARISVTSSISGSVEIWPKVHGRESSVSVKPTFIISNTISNHSPLNDRHGPVENDMDGPSTEFQFEEKPEIQ
jgi:methionine sulfoxide reductase heme-binding subunit